MLAMVRTKVVCLVGVPKFRVMSDGVCECTKTLCVWRTVVCKGG